MIHAGEARSSFRRKTVGTMAAELYLPKLVGPGLTTSLLSSPPDPNPGLVSETPRVSIRHPDWGLTWRPLARK